MKCPDWEILSRYQDGSLDETPSREICEHLMGCLSCQEKMRSLGRAGLYFRIGLASRRNTECPDEEALGAYLSGTMARADRRRIEGHLVQCARCLHEVAVLSEADTLRRTSASPVPTASALERFKRMVPSVPRRSAWRLAFTRGVRAAAAVLVVAVVIGMMVTPTSVEKSRPVSALLTTATTGGAAYADAGEFAQPVKLESDTAVLQPDGTALAEFAREAGVLLREIELIAAQPHADRLRLVQEDILNSGIIESVARLKERAGDRRDLAFLNDCEYLLMRVVKAEGENLKADLAELISEIRRLNLIETARLVEMEGGWSQWLASRQ